MTPDIRAFRIGDHAEARGLWESTEGVGLSDADSLESISRFLERNPSLSFVAVDRAILVGTVLCGHDGRRGLIHHLVVSPAWRRKGLGRALVSRALASLRAANIQKCHLLLFRDNGSGRAFWESIGAEERVSLTTFSVAIDDGDCANAGAASHRPAVQVRPATSNDYAGIAALFVHIDDLHLAARPDLFRVAAETPRSAEYVNDLIRRDDAALLVVGGASGLVAAAVAYLRTTEASSVLAGRRFVLLDMIVTHPEHRRTGIGASLIRAIEGWARDHEATAVELGVHEFNAGARRFYENLGYGTMTRRMETKVSIGKLEPTR